MMQIYTILQIYRLPRSKDTSANKRYTKSRQKIPVMNVWSSFPVFFLFITHCLILPTLYFLFQARCNLKIITYLCFLNHKYEIWPLQSRKSLRRENLRNLFVSITGCIRITPIPCPTCMTICLTHSTRRKTQRSSSVKPITSSPTKTIR